MSTRVSTPAFLFILFFYLQQTANTYIQYVRRVAETASKSYVRFDLCLPNAVPRRYRIRHILVPMLYAVPPHFAHAKLSRQEGCIDRPTGNVTELLVFSLHMYNCIRAECRVVSGECRAGHDVPNQPNIFILIYFHLIMCPSKCSLAGACLCACVLVSEWVKESLFVNIS